MKVPGDLYRRSARKFGDANTFTYAPYYLQRRVRRDGNISLNGQYVYISEALVGYDVGLEKTGEDEYQVWYCDLKLGEINLKHGPKLRPTASASVHTKEEV